MDDHNLSRSQYEAFTMAFEPLCPGCLDMNRSIFDWRAVSWANIYPILDPQKIVMGVKSHCSSCMVIKAAFQSVGLDLHKPHDIQNISLSHREGKGSLIASAVLGRSRCITVELYTIPDKSFSPWTIITCMTQPSGDTASEGGFHRIQQWIKNCKSSHKRCSNQKSLALPTRVLDIGKSNDSIRLLETSGKSGSYVCLSHCWGESSTILCTGETYKSYQNNIAWASLPLLFQNAIETCRMLGFQYLWIDKLCIIQHDEKDWAREGSKMSQIFENSSLTIAAAISKDDTESLFFEDKEHSLGLKSHTGQSQDGSSYTIYFRIPFDYHPADNQNSQSSREKHPLMTRAWVYQERLLAPRTLYFGEELSWRCGEASACECSEDNYRMDYSTSLSLSPGHSNEKLHLNWQKMVEEFTWLQLSFEEDRLPAFSGLAQQYQPRLGSEYLAGLWRENLVADLMWFACPVYGAEAEPYSTKRPNKWRAPTWSWASVEGPILFSKNNRTLGERGSTENFTNQVDIKVVVSLVDIISAECLASSPDPMGTVATGHLVLKGSGRLASLKHREICKDSDTRHFTVKHTGIRSVYIRSNFSVGGHEANVDYDLIKHGLMRSNSEMSVYCLCLASVSFIQRTFLRHEGDYSLSPVYRTWSLLLHRVDDKNFERVGLLVSDHHDNGYHFQKSLRDCTVTII